ncbi:aminotransferase class V-fold PLP-dependent enzyme [Alienimonas californiensis]|uniref:cysteine desulfurase n=1 Tax=Alienimonas californiensis TaxID=2527989 RepID=A0A517PCH0_9PLAN|nr:aminotransferase class V-fold PLP-dependent enzyme [Alienimonas californiensis]QDT17060.1 putative cysteine desulfurase [Alienimonas californiensis]
MQTVYLDHAATSLPKAPGVADAVRAALELPSPGRGNTRRGAEAAALLTRCRSAVARLLGVGSPDRIVFTAGGTDALNLALFGLLKPGEHAVVGDLEHTSVTRPLAALRGGGGVLSTLSSDEDGLYRPDELDALLSAPPAAPLVALSHGSNVVGTVQPVAELAAVCRERGALLLLDACQTAGHVPIDVDGWGVDLLATGAHKGLLGPPGVGVLIVGERAERRLTPTRLGGTGGGGGDDMPAELPHRLEPGTPNLPGIAGLLAAVEWIEGEGVGALHARSVECLGRLIDRLAALPGVRILGPPDAAQRCGLVSVTLPGWESMEAAAVLDASFGVECRAGLHCAPGAHARYGTRAEGGAVRFSVGPFTTPAEIDAAAEAVTALLS